MIIKVSRLRTEANLRGSGKSLKKIHLFHFPFHSFAVYQLPSLLGLCLVCGLLPIVDERFKFKERVRFSCSLNKF